MWKSKKLILILTLAILALVGGTTGAVLAADSGDDSTADTLAETQADTQREALLDRICEIYEENTGVAIDADQLQSAFQQAREELQLQALTERLQAMVTNGTITQEEADAFLLWWGERPDMDLQGIMGGLMEGPMGHHHRGGHFMDGGPYCSDSLGDASDTL